MHSCAAAGTGDVMANKYLNIHRLILCMWTTFNPDHSGLLADCHTLAPPVNLNLHACITHRALMMIDIFCPYQLIAYGHDPQVIPV